MEFVSGIVLPPTDAATIPSMMARLARLPFAANWNGMDKNTADALGYLFARRVIGVK